MKLIPRGRTKALLGLALVASSVVAVAPLSNTAQAGPGDPPAGPATISPASGALTGTFNLSLPVGASCPGDGPAGYRWGTYITPLTNDVGGMLFAGSGQPTGQPAFTSALRESPGGIFLSARTPGLTNGLIPVPIPTLQWLGVAPPAGSYNIGIACTLNNGTAIVNTRYWNTQITVLEPTPGSFTFVQGIPELAPDAPVITGVTGTTVNFTQADANPDVTGFTATVTPTNPAGAALAPIAVPAGATSFVIPPASLVVGTTYSVTLVATNSVGNSDLSNAASFRYDESFPISVTALDVFDGDDVIVDWTAPGGPAPASYDVVITDDASAVVATQTGVAGLSATFAGIPQGTDYTATVTGNYATPGASSTGQATFSVNPNALIVQEITVTRPPGALILTQRCGVFGPLPAYTADAAFPGFPFDLPAGGPTADQVGTSPDIDLAAPGVQPDPEFPNYPFPIPATYPTECGLNMGTASFVNSGPFAGQFYAASGRLNEVTVVDTRDNDAGWTVRGDIEDLFTGSTGDTFDGDFLGWVPSVTSDSDPSGSFTYDQLVTAGPAVKSGTTGGLTGNPVLASAPAGSGLGIAELDARMTLLIPLDADAADYSGTLTLTVA